ncbi:alpha-amylase [Aerococcaceae bacterium DSM 111022]|nr:alpha-amylase [Aerococcaceae bacterium DSM 111022]
MAENTSKTLRHMHLYSVFVRNFSEEGTFDGVTKELDRIKQMDVDVIWLLPFYPNGEKNKKGSIGSPYAIKDYRAIDPTQGDIDSFKNLINEAHKRDMKVMIDIVFNHTSPDSVLANEHPEWFYKTPEGNFGNRVGDWSDIIDLDYAHRGLWEYQIETLKYWAQYVDGFRVDVAPLVPLAFWKEARERVAEVNPEMIWLSESVEPNFIKELRSKGLTALSDSEIYQVFDMTYDYDVRHAFEDYLTGKIQLSEYTRLLDHQDTVYPENYVKMRNLENHDRDRITSFVSNERVILEWSAFNYFQKGSALIYNGQEVQAEHTPSLFEIDKIDWNFESGINDYLAHLSRLKRQHVPIENVIYRVTGDDESGAIIASYESEQVLYGIFNVGQTAEAIPVLLEDGEYVNLLNEEKIVVEDGAVPADATPIWIQK